MTTAGSRARRLAQWASLAAGSLAVASGFHALQLPASFLIGPLIAAIALRVVGVELRVPRPLFLASQSVVGAMVGSVLTPSIIHTFRTEWPVLGGTVAVIVVVASLSGWALSHFGVVPGTTGVWGSSPGAASAMVILSEAHGGDVRLVAFMQYLRVLFVASTAAIVARVWLGTGAAPQPVHLFAAIDGPTFAATLAVVVPCGLLGVLSRVPSGAMLLPLVVTASLHGTGTMDFVYPPWLLILAYTGLGWTIGLGFNRGVIGHAARAMPWIVVSIVVLMAVSAGLAVLLVRMLGVDPLTAFLATSPGGMDTVAIIAASTPVDVSFVMSLQAVRFFVLILLGPTVSKWVALRLARATEI